MEWLKNRSLKQAFFMISSFFLAAGIICAAGSFFLCSGLSDRFRAAPYYEITVDENGHILYSGIPRDALDLTPESTQEGRDSIPNPAQKYPAQAPGRNNLSWLFDLLQFVLPIFFVAFSLLLADLAFYRLKLKKPLQALKNGAQRIQRQDLNFVVKHTSGDELGELCDAFELMRKELAGSYKELWRQTEERRRLNAAFSHDLRNPVTVLKGCASMLRKSLAADPFPVQSAAGTISLLSQYTERIESYVEIMTAAQKLEEWTCSPRPVSWSALVREWRQSLPLLAEASPQKLCLSYSGGEASLYADRAFLDNVAENLITNALRYARSEVNASFRLEENRILLEVTDDGDGFSPSLLQKGITPFLREEADTRQEHFGMGLYISKLLCEKHGGSLEIANTHTGARVTACFDINCGCRL